jgi:hypothetical protein
MAMMAMRSLVEERDYRENRFIVIWESDPYCAYMPKAYQATQDWENEIRQ